MINIKDDQLLIGSTGGYGIVRINVFLDEKNKRRPALEVVTISPKIRINMFLDDKYKRRPALDWLNR